MEPGARADADAVVIGVVGPAHGLDGDVYVRPQTDDPARFAQGAAVVVGGRPTTVVRSATHRNRLLVRFDGVTDRTGAEALRGAEVVAPRTTSDDSGDTYSGHDLLGMSVVTGDGLWLGEVTAIIDVPHPAGYELLEVDADGVTWLLPDDDDLCEVGDADGQDVLVLIDPPDGLVPPELLVDDEAGEG